MTINEEGTFRRTGTEEKQDTAQAIENLKAELWTSWPNEAGFDRLEEHRGPIDLPVKGTIPPWTAGSLYRTGPGQSTIPNTAKGIYHVSHWFDGLAHTHKFDILPNSTGGVSVKYSSRRQAEALAEDIKKKGWRSGTSFAQRSDPCVGIFAKAMSVFQPAPPKNNAVVVERNVPGLQTTTGSKNVFIMTDNSTFHEVNPETLEPIAYTGAAKLHPELTGPLGCAHSQRDPKTGDLFNFNLELGRRPAYRVFRVNASNGTTDILATISMPEIKPAYIHSLFLTDNYVVLCIPSSHYAWNGLKIVWKRNLVEAIEPFDEAKLSQWIVVDRRQGKGVVARFTTPAGFFFHSVNAFEEVVEENGQKRIELNFEYVGYNNCDVIHSFYYDVMLNRKGATREFWLDKLGYNTCQSSLIRYRFRMPSEQQLQRGDQLPTAEKVICIPSPHVGDLPTINDVYSTRPHRYVYSASLRGLSTLTDSLCKTDTSTSEALIWAPVRGHTPGEPIFVPRPEAEAEDDGVILSVVLDGTNQRSYLVCLDARDMEEMGRAECSFAIGLGFHGTHGPVVKI